MLAHIATDGETELLTIQTLHRPTYSGQRTKSTEGDDSPHLSSASTRSQGLELKMVVPQGGFESIPTIDGQCPRSAGRSIIHLFRRVSSPASGPARSRTSPISHQLRGPGLVQDSKSGVLTIRGAARVVREEIRSAAVEQAGATMANELGLFIRRAVSSGFRGPCDATSLFRGRLVRLRRETRVL